MRKALGRGLDALIPAGTAPAAAAHDGVRTVPLAKIRANHLQPRKHFDPEKLSELASSIKEHGLAQPILVSHDAATDSYEIIAGERRLRASELAGLKEVEVIVRAPESDKKRLALAMVENLQREDLNPIEQALGYLRLSKEFGISKSELAAVVGKSPSAVSNTMRLLNLPEEIQKAIQFGQLTEGHARALLMIENPLERKRLFDIVVAEKLSVRQAEDLARQAASGHGLDKSAHREPAPKAADVKSIESTLEHALGTKVEVKTGKDPKKGRIVINFYTLDDFDRIVKMIIK